MRRLTYTFDNGPDPGATGALLDFLAERDIRATFFVVGERLDNPAARALMQRAHDEGHWIGNHTLTHGAPLGRGPDDGRAAREIGEAQLRLGACTHARRFFRPNGAGSVGRHLLSAAAVSHLAAHRHTVITWTSAPGDWMAPHEAWFDRALLDVAATPWTVLVLHDTHIARMLPLLARFHDRLLSDGVVIEQDFPEACVPMDRGVPRAGLAEISTGPSPGTPDL